MKIGYFADGPWSHSSFQKLVSKKNTTITFVCVRFNSPDQKLIKMAIENKIPVLMEKNINEKKFLDKIEKFDCDIYISMSFNQIFKKDILNLPPKGIINCHAGKLPFYRGRNVLNWVLINDEKEFGITVHYVDEGIDTGDIILQKTYVITEKDDYNSLLKRAYVECANLLDQAIDVIDQGILKPIKQTSIDILGFYCSGRKKGDEKINWNQSSRKIFNFVRALTYPGPSAETSINNKVVKIHKVKYLHNAKEFTGIPGAILEKKNGTFIVKTLDSFIQIVEWDTDVDVKVGDRLS